MIEAPKQDWLLYEERCRTEHLRWLRGLSDDDSLKLYASLHSLAAQMNALLTHEGREQRAWQEKLAVRRKIVMALTQLDRLRHGRELPSTDTG